MGSTATGENAEDDHFDRDQPTRVTDKDLGFAAFATMMPVEHLEFASPRRALPSVLFSSKNPPPQFDSPKEHQPASDARHHSTGGVGSPTHKSALKGSRDARPHSQSL